MEADCLWRARSHCRDSRLTHAGLTGDECVPWDRGGRNGDRDGRLACGLTTSYQSARRVRYQTSIVVATRNSRTDLV